MKILPPHGFVAKQVPDPKSESGVAQYLKLKKVTLSSLSVRTVDTFVAILL